MMNRLFTKGIGTTEMLDRICGAYSDCATIEEMNVLGTKRKEMIQEFCLFESQMRKDSFDDVINRINAKYDRLINHEKYEEQEGWEMIEEERDEFYALESLVEQIDSMMMSADHRKADRRKKTNHAKARKADALSYDSTFRKAEQKANGCIKSVKCSAKKPNAYKRTHIIVTLDDYIPYELEVM